MKGVDRYKVGTDHYSSACIGTQNWILMPHAPSIACVFLLGNVHGRLWGYRYSGILPYARFVYNVLGNTSVIEV